MEEWSTAGGGGWGGADERRDGGGGGEEGVKGKGDLISTLLGLRGWVWSRRRWGGGRDERLQGKGTARVPGVQLRRVFPRLFVQKQNKKGRKR